MIEPLKIARIKAGLTQTQLRDRSGVSVVTISGTENGKSFPGPITRSKLEEAIGCEIDWAQTYYRGSINYKPNKRNPNAKSYNYER